ncbi:uncharacterized protein LOC115886240 [Sitophilus oryzae]|uniref:Uncharacterized protein LOC115886240 n=1 Tax=Sitophilus oryzae TaxID=7048 RepID=A0A6J2YBD6_SITOR|nr:uncharacterized protein LOC115886240 [Sitophilus oryzae]
MDTGYRGRGYTPFFGSGLKFDRSDYIRFKLNKQEDNSSKFNEIISTHFQDKIKFFSDASKENFNVGIGVVCPDLKIENTYRIAKFATIYTGEMVAIMKALELIETRNTYNSLILSDIQSAPKAISSIPAYKDDHITYSIKKKLIGLKEGGFSISLGWISSHTHIKGNDRADYMARIGRRNGQNVKIKCWYKEFYPVLKEKFWGTWLERWKEDSRQKGRLYAELIEKPYKYSWFGTLGNISRKKITTVIRIRSGHCLTPVHLHRIRVKDDPRCQCGEEGTLNHIFFQCPLYPEQRETLYKSITNHYKFAPHDYTSLLHASLALIEYTQYRHSTKEEDLDYLSRVQDKYSRETTNDLESDAFTGFSCLKLKIGDTSPGRIVLEA